MPSPFRGLLAVRRNALSARAVSSDNDSKTDPAASQDVLGDRAEGSSQAGKYTAITAVPKYTSPRRALITKFARRRTKSEDTARS